MRAISVFIFDTGMSTRRCFDPQALRIRVSMSAIGSVMLMSDSLVLSYPEGRGGLNVKYLQLTAGSCQLPARLPHARDHPEQRQLAEADAAEAEAAQEGARAPAATTPVVLPDLELRLPLALLDHGLTSHYSRAPVLSLPRNGIPSSLSRANARSSRPAVVTNVMSIPWIVSIES